MQAICDGFALAHGVKIELELRNVFDVLINDSDLSEAYMEAAAEIVGAGNIIERQEPATGSEDFADMLKVVPGAYCIVGHGGTVPLHNPAFTLDPEILPIGASVMARMVEKRLPL
jgi:metal-dependent amidase/aminoacylase/carboxypeptidase family protein